MLSPRSTKTSDASHRIRETLLEGLAPVEEDDPYNKELEKDWRKWLRTFFNPHLSDHLDNPIDFATHHEEFWEWVWAIERGVRPKSFVAVWPRGAAKSTSAEMAIVALGAMKRRKYVLYVSGTQEQADDHVQNVASMMESKKIGYNYPALGERKLNKYGSSKGWRRNRIRTDYGITVDAIGLDTAARGAKVDEDRPDLIVIDDVDGENDSIDLTDKKIRTITRKLIPAGADDLAVLAVQNLIHPDSIFSQMVDGRARFLVDRKVSGPIPAIEDIEFQEHNGRFLLTGGTPTWEGMDLSRCQKMIDDMGPEAFLAECQQLVDDPTKRIFQPEWWDVRINPENRYDPADHRIKNSVSMRWLSFDTAMKTKEESDYSAMVIGELMPDHRLNIRRVHMERFGFPDLPQFIEEMAHRYSYDDKLAGVIVEDKGSGISALQTLQNSSPAWIANLLIPFNPGATDKEYRGKQAAVWCRRGCVRLPHPTPQVPWLAPFERELFRFPEVIHDDQVDAFDQLLIYLEAILANGWRFRQGVA